MEYSSAGLIGSAVALGVGLTSYLLTVPFVEKRLRAIDRSETAEQRQDLEFKLGVMRRLILTMDVVVFGLGGYWLGKAVGG